MRWTRTFLASSRPAAVAPPDKGALDGVKLATLSDEVKRRQIALIARYVAKVRAR